MSIDLGLEDLVHLTRKSLGVEVRSLESAKARIPAGESGKGGFKLSPRDLDDILAEGAKVRQKLEWAMTMIFREWR